MTEATQLEEDAFATLLDEEPVDNDAVLDELDAVDREEEGEDEVGGREVPREGTDVVLKRLDDTDPAAARVLRAEQRRMSQQQNEFSDLKTEMLDTLVKLRGITPGETAETEDGERPELPAGITDGHLQMFQSMADHFGYEPRQAVEERETIEKRESFATEALKEGVERWGADFGTIGDDGEIRLAPGVAEKLADVEGRVTDPSRGITTLDFFQLAGLAPSEAAEVEETLAKDNESTRGVPRSRVVRRSTGGGRAVKIYDPARGDSREDVFARAWALARKELGG